MKSEQDRTTRYQEASLTLPGTLFPLAFLAAAIVISFSSYSYIKISNAYPSAGVVGNFLGATALGILAFKGFTTITNSGSEVKDPHRNVSRAIVISIAACVVIYTLVGFAVVSNLSLAEIVETQDYSLAAAARPALGEYGLWFTVAIAMMATTGGILASIFAVAEQVFLKSSSRRKAMESDESHGRHH